MRSWFRALRRQFMKPPCARIYLDYAAASPLSPVAAAAMRPFLHAEFGNPSAIHAEGRVARAAIEAARTEVAGTLGVRPAGVVFVSGGTEGNALAIVGYLMALAAQGRDLRSMEVITTAIEHPSVLEALRHVARLGVVVKTVPVDGAGFITIAALMSLLSAQTVLVTFAYANSEIGTVQRVRELARAVRAYQRAHRGVTIKIHVDAAQAPLWLPCQLPQLDVDMLTLDGGKCGGPKGSGAVVTRGLVPLTPVLWGGGQEQGLRPGTENVAGIVGFAAALTEAQEALERRVAAVAAIRDAGIAHLRSALPTAVLNGPEGIGRLPNNINISIPGLDTEYAVVALDVAGVAASTKSACAGADGGESEVVLAITGDTARARSTIRLTLGETSTVADIATTARLLADHYALQSTLTL